MVEPFPNLPYEHLTFLKPTFGFVSIGEYFFTYNTNEGYPNHKGAWLRGYYEHKGRDNEEVTLLLTHDDPTIVYLNDKLLYREDQSLSGFHTFHIKATVKAGNNVFVVKIENYENTNTRAWVLGLDVRLASDPVPKGMFGADVHVQQRGNTVVVEDACE